MKYNIIIPAHNEEAHLGKTLNSVFEQTLLPQQVVVVNDNSQDSTETVIDSFAKEHPSLKKINIRSSQEHLPGSKVIKAFNAGLEVVNQDYDFIVKLDADLVLPPSYFETIADTFKNQTNTGIVGGFIYEKNKKGQWVRKHPMHEDHVRGAFKAYSKACFSAMNGLRPAMGWDTVDELLARYHGFAVRTLPELQVQHARPTGKAYDLNARQLQGQAMYAMRYGTGISIIASLKMAVKQKDYRVLIQNLRGYRTAQKNRIPYLVSVEEGAFIRNYRWRNILRKLL